MNKIYLKFFKREVLQQYSLRGSISYISCFVKCRAQENKLKNLVGF